MNNLKRYWFQFSGLASGDIFNLGCGITAFDHNDAIEILGKRVFADGKMPNIKNVIENIDIAKLDQGHVIPNMAPPNNRGVWFPLGYQ